MGKSSPLTTVTGESYLENCYTVIFEFGGFRRVGIRRFVIGFRKFSSRSVDLGIDETCGLSDYISVRCLEMHAATTMNSFPRNASVRQK